MFNALFDSSTVSLLQQAAAFAERRHEILAGNVANISTPDYHTRDLPVAQFQEALAEAVSRRRAQGRAGGAEAWSFTAPSGTPPTADLFPRTLFQAAPATHPSLSFQDGSNRSIEKEVMEMTKNSLMQSLAIELMTVQLNRLQAVISERA